MVRPWEEIRDIQKENADAKRQSIRCQASPKLPGGVAETARSHGNTAACGTAAQGSKVGFVVLVVLLIFLGGTYFRAYPLLVFQLGAPTYRAVGSSLTFDVNYYRCNKNPAVQGRPDCLSVHSNREELWIFN